MINYKWLAIQELNDYDAKVAAIESIQDNIKRLEEEAENLHSTRYDSEPTQGGGNRREEMLISNISTRDEYRRNLNIVIGQVHAVETALKGLDARQQRILELFYIRRCRNYIDRLCEEMCVSERTLYREKENALKAYTLRRHGITEL